MWRDKEKGYVRTGVCYSAEVRRLRRDKGEGIGEVKSAGVGDSGETRRKMGRPRVLLLYCFRGASSRQQIVLSTTIAVCKTRAGTQSSRSAGITQIALTQYRRASCQKSQNAVAAYQTLSISPGRRQGHPVADGQCK